ncbi:MAG: hypothetical protein LUQ24_04160 [Methanobacterium sp.]|nr:hypothetical protein [Methanobacterium sp.]
MKKYRINTTISSKHQAMLEEFKDEYGTQQRVLEYALESLKNNQPKSGFYPEEDLWIRIGREIKSTIIFLQKDLGKLLFETIDFEKFTKYVENERPSEFGLQWYYNKPLKECSLQEIVEYIVIKLKIQGGADIVNWTEDKDSYLINYTHSLGINCSKMIVIMDESVFKSYGAEFETSYSERSVFFKVYKD